MVFHCSGLCWRWLPCLCWASPCIGVHCLRPVRTPKNPANEFLHPESAR